MDINSPQHYRKDDESLFEMVCGLIRWILSGYRNAAREDNIILKWLMFIGWTFIWILAVCILFWLCVTIFLVVVGINAL